LVQHEFDAASAWVPEITILLVVALDSTDTLLSLSQQQILGRGAGVALLPLLRIYGKREIPAALIVAL